MNLLLLEPSEVDQSGRTVLTGRRCEHVRSVFRASVGDVIRVGVVGGQVGSGEVVGLDDEHVALRCVVDQDPPAPLALTLVLALPRPPVVRRVLQHVAAIGIKRVFLIHARRVEKSYWQSSTLAPPAIRGQLVLGLEQGRDTILPEVVLSRRFRPFVEDELPRVAEGTIALVADPEAARPCPAGIGGRVTLAVGPEGGFVPFEIELLRAQGFAPVHLGARPLRVETAVAALVGRLCGLE